MSRPQRGRRICAMPAYTRVSSVGASGDVIRLALDEYESIRLMDLVGCTHEQCAGIMQISRTTVTEIYASARHKLAQALVYGRALEIDGGQVRVCDRSDPCLLVKCDASVRDR